MSYIKKSYIKKEDALYNIGVLDRLINDKMQKTT